MKNTSFALNKHFTDFIEEQVSTGRFQSSSEVIRAGLRLLEQETQQMNALRELVSVGINQADSGDFVDYPLSAVIAEIEDDTL